MTKIRIFKVSDIGKVYSELGHRLQREPKSAALKGAYRDASLWVRMRKAVKVHADWQRIYDQAYKAELALGRTAWRADNAAVGEIAKEYPKYSRRHIRREIIPH
jgi:hypothetical protein